MQIEFQWAFPLSSPLPAFYALGLAMRALCPGQPLHWELCPISFCLFSHVGPAMPNSVCCTINIILFSESFPSAHVCCLCSPLKHTFLLTSHTPLAITHLLVLFWSKTPWKVCLWFFFLLLSWTFSPISSVQSLSHVRLFVTLWTAAWQSSLSITNSWIPPKPMSMKSMMPSNYLILCHPLLLPSTFPNIRVFSNEWALYIGWPKYWSVSFNLSPSNEHPGVISFRMDWLDLVAVQGTLKSLLQHHSSKASALFTVQLIHTWLLEKP